MHLPLLIAALHVVRAARLLHSIPEDTYAFPKSRVSFLNSKPLLNETAWRWFNQGLPGGELEFLDQPWQDGHSPNLKEIDSGDAVFVLLYFSSLS